MEDQNLRVDKEQEVISNSNADLARKLLKKEQRLLTRLQEAQEAEARASDRFRRAQARLQKRRGRLERIESNLLQVQKKIVDLQIADQQTENVEPELTIVTSSEVVPIIDADGTATVQSEPELVTVADSNAIVVLAASEAVSTSESDGITDQRSEQIEPAPGMAATTEPTPITDSEEIAPVESEAELVATPDAIPVVVPAAIEGENITLSDTDIAGSNRIEAEVDATPAAGTPSDSTEEHEPTAVSVRQDITLAKEAWVAAESAVQNARNTAHGLAASISLLSQSGGLSDELMAELLRKQSEANKALLRAQDAARLTYEKFVQAQEEAERAASRPVEVSMDTSGDQAQQNQQNQENGASPAEEDNVADQTVEMHAVRLYDAW